MFALARKNGTFPKEEKEAEGRSLVLIENRFQLRDARVDGEASSVRARARARANPTRGKYVRERAALSY